MAIKSCVRCGKSFETRQKTNAKYCPLCRLKTQYEKYHQYYIRKKLAALKGDRHD